MNPERALARQAQRRRAIPSTTMKTQAGLKCSCKECERAALQASASAEIGKENEELEEHPF